MNDRIEKLAMEANYRTGNEFDLNSKPLDALLTKFAELIVKECIDAIDAEEYTMGGDTEAKGMRFSISIIKAHFGVQE